MSDGRLCSLYGGYCSVACACIHLDAQERRPPSHNTEHQLKCLATGHRSRRFADGFVAT